MSSRNGIPFMSSARSTGIFASPSLKKGRGFGMKSSRALKKMDSDAS